MKEMEKEEIAYFMKRLYSRGLTTTSGGNISMRKDSSSILITPSGPDKGRLTAETICEISTDVKNFSLNHKPSMETLLHLEIYKRRSDITAIIHAHPPWTTALSAAGKKIKTNLTGESRFILGEITIVPYALMGSEELAMAAAKAAAKTDVLIIENHGPVCLGLSLEDAFNKIEVLEAAAKTTCITELLGGANELTHEQISEIDKLR